MKDVFLLTIGLIISMTCRSQDVNLPKNSEGKVEYSSVVNVDSISADILFSKAKLFITEAFKSGKDVTQLIDEATKTIIGKGTIKVEVAKMLGMVFPGYVKFTVTISSKEGRYKYIFTNFILDYQGGTSQPRIEASLDNENNPRTVSKKQWAFVKGQVNETILLMIKDLKSTMQKNEEW